MSYSFEYIDIILLAMIAGFIFLRLRGILGKKTGFEEDINSTFPHEAPASKPKVDLNEKGGPNLQLSFFNLDDPVLEAIKEEIKDLDIDNLTPVEALMQLNNIKRKLSQKKIK